MRNEILAELENRLPAEASGLSGTNPRALARKMRYADIREREDREIMEALRQLAEKSKSESAAQEAGDDTAEQAEYDRGVAVARDRIFAAYPVFASNDSIERLALDAYVNRALADPARREDFRNPNWPAKLAVEFANKYGIKVGAAKSIIAR